MTWMAGLSNEAGNIYRIRSDKKGGSDVTAVLTIAVTDREAQIQTTFGDPVTVSRAEFLRLVRGIIRENDGSE